MKRLLSAAAAAALMLTAVSPAMAGDISKGARPAKVAASPTKHHSKAHAAASHFAAVPGKKHFGAVVMTKAQLNAQHHFSSAAIPNLAGKAKGKAKP